MDDPNHVEHQIGAVGRQRVVETRRSCEVVDLLLTSATAWGFDCTESWDDRLLTGQIDPWRTVGCALQRVLNSA
jgi:hypothetical protein